jgi:hypothetical protein
MLPSPQDLLQRNWVLIQPLTTKKLALCVIKRFRPDQVPERPGGQRYQAPSSNTHLSVIID